MSTTTQPATAATTHTVYGVYARHNGKPAGFCGYYRTKAEAMDSRRAGGRIKRETMTDAQWSAWQANGFTSRSGWSV